MYFDKNYCKLLEKVESEFIVFVRTYDHGSRDYGDYDYVWGKGAHYDFTYSDPDMRVQHLLAAGAQLARRYLGN